MTDGCSARTSACVPAPAPDRAAFSPVTALDRSNET